MFDWVLKAPLFRWFLFYGVCYNTPNSSYPMDTKTYVERTQDMHIGQSSQATKVKCTKDKARSKIRGAELWHGEEYADENTF